MIKKIRAVVVDDSAFMRKSISIMLESDPDIEVVGTAKDGLEGYELINKIRPDIATLDVEMPRMDGITALKKIMEDCPTSVIMVSSLTTEGAEQTIKALELGAVDFIPKELSYVSINIVKIKEDLIRKVKEIVKQKSVQIRLRRLQAPAKHVAEPHVKTGEIEYLPKMDYKAIALGVSTGGPMSLQKVIPKLSKDIKCPMFIVQHMPPKFTKSLAERLNGISELQVKEAEDNEAVKGGCVYFAPGGFHMHLRKRSDGEVRIEISEQPIETLHRPSVDVMLSSVLEVYGKHTLGVIMTGMGKDGFESLKELKGLGGSIIAQDEDTCVVYGMPKAVVEGGLANTVVPLERIYEVINKAVL